MEDSKIISLAFLKKRKVEYKKTLGDIPVHTNYVCGIYDDGTASISQVNMYFKLSSRKLFFHLDNLDNYTNAFLKIYRSKSKEEVGVLEEKKKELNLLEINVERLKKEIIELEKAMRNKC